MMDTRPMVPPTWRSRAEKDGVVQSNGANIAARDGPRVARRRRSSRRSPSRPSTARWSCSRPSGRRPASSRSSWRPAPAASCCTRPSATVWRPTSTAREPASTPTMMGERIAPDFVTIVDDGTLDNMRGSINVDDEGVESQNTVLVEDGDAEELPARPHQREALRRPERRARAAASPSGTSRSCRACARRYMHDGPHGYDEIIASRSRAPGSSPRPSPTGRSRSAPATTPSTSRTAG